MAKKTRSFKITLILEAFHNLEKSYTDLKKQISINKDEFVNNKLVLDKVRIDFNLSFESCMRVCRHMSSVIGLKTSSKNCLVKLAEFIKMPEHTKLQEFTDFYLKYRDLKNAVTPSELYDFLNENLYLFKEFARYVIEYIKTSTGNYYLIDFDMLNEKSKHIKESVKKIDFIISQGLEEFKSKPMYHDRSKYFYQVAYDSLYDICKHLAPKFGIKKFGDDCLSKMIEHGIIPDSYYMDIIKMTTLKNKLISTWEIEPKELYTALKEASPKFQLVVKEISSSLQKLLKQKKTDTQKQ